MRGPERQTTLRARTLRRSDNDAESALWSELRNRRLNGYKFVRQEPIGRYFADFAMHSVKLVVEVDGSQHAESQYDRLRDEFMVGEGWSVLRFWNVDVLQEREQVLETILAAVEGSLDCHIAAPDLQFRASATYRENTVNIQVAPHPYPLPVKNGERGISTSMPRSLRFLRGEGKGEGLE